jgi:hypothetical protein
MYKLKIGTILLAVLFFASCETFTSFEDFQENPNESTVATPGLLLTNIQISVFNSISIDAGLASRYLIEINRPRDPQYFTWDRDSFGLYNSLRQTVKMKEEATRLDNQNMFTIADLLQVHIFHELTRRFGDIPYFEALQAEESNFQPAYDFQEEIYSDLLNRLEDINSRFNLAQQNIQGDVVFNGDVLKWKKFGNSLKLRILMSLSEIDNTSIDFVDQFQQIITNPAEYPVMESNDDSFKYEYSDATGDRYPFFNSASFSSRFLAETVVDLYVEKQDPRLFNIAEPDTRDESVAADFNSYSGLVSSNTVEENNLLRADGIGSQLNFRYLNDPEADPNQAFGYSELSFIIAEAAQRGWINENPETHYQNGIRASMSFYNIDGETAETYLQSEFAQFDPSIGLELILEQKYMAMLLNSGWEPFYDQRRTGIPAFDVGSGANQLNNGMVPNRWMYPEDENNTNQENLLEAIQRQFQGNDSINGEIWIAS